MINKQALDLAKKWLKDIEGVRSATSILATAALAEIEAIESQPHFIDAPSDDRLRAALEEVRVQIQNVQIAVEVGNKFRMKLNYYKLSSQLTMALDEINQALSNTEPTDAQIELTGAQRVREE